MSPYRISCIVSLLWLVTVVTICHGLQMEIHVQNRCPFRIFVRNERAEIGGFNLEPNQSQRWNVRGTTEANKYQAKPRLWGEKGCSSSGQNCDPVPHGSFSLAEWNLQDYGDATFRGYTWYDVSLVDGFNLPMTMEPYQGGNVGGNCYTSGCNFDLNNCPGESRISSRGHVIACRNNNRDSPNTNYVNVLKQQCPNVYTWSKDDSAGQRACRQGNSGLRIYFC